MDFQKLAIGLLFIICAAGLVASIIVQWDVEPVVVSAGVIVLDQGHERKDVKINAIGKDKWCGCEGYKLPERIQSSWEFDKMRSALCFPGREDIQRFANENMRARYIFHYIMCMEIGSPLSEEAMLCWSDLHMELWRYTYTVTALAEILKPLLEPYLDGVGFGNIK